MKRAGLRKLCMLILSLVVIFPSQQALARRKDRKQNQIVLRQGQPLSYTGIINSRIKKARARKGVELRVITVKKPGKSKKKRGRKDSKRKARNKTIVICLAGCDPLTPTSYTESLLTRGASVTVQGVKLRGGKIYANSISVSGHTDAPTFSHPFDQRDAARFLHQATFGPTRAEVEGLSTAGYNQWFAAQMAAPPCLTVPRLYEIAARRDGEVWQIHFQDAWWKCVLFGQDQLRQRVAFALSEIFVVSFNSAALEGQAYAVGSYYDMLVQNAFGNYRDLLEAVTLHPTMGSYLSSLKNPKADPAQNRFPDENYAREIMQLFSIGLLHLNQNGTLRLNANGLPMRTYTQDTIRGFAKVFTGWTWWQDVPVDQRRFWFWPENERHWLYPMVEVEEYHSQEPKELLNGAVLPPGQTARQDLKQALDVLFHHPNVAPFISRRLIQRLVHSNPSPDYIARVASVFNDNGAGVRGDLAAVVRAILLDPEARLPEIVALSWYGKMREPVIALANLLRIFKARSPEDEYLFWNLESPHTLNQAPLNSPTVFNFFDPDYTYPGLLASYGLYLPEFQLTNVTSTIGRASSFGVWVLWWRFNLEFDFSEELPLVGSPSVLVDHVDLLLTAGSMSPELKTFITQAIEGFRWGDEDYRIRKVIQLVCLSPEFMIQQ